jgi:hypothetical protein
MIVVYEIVFQQDGMLSSTDGGKKRLKKLPPPLIKDDAVMTMGDRQLTRPKPPQQPDKAAKTLFMFMVFASHGFQATGIVRRPTEAISAVITSPALTGPTPAGVPVRRTSPGSRVKMLEI